MDLLLAMRVFARVVETGSLSKAVEQLELSRGSGTKLMQRLEKHLQVTLLQRTTRRMVVTPDGAAYYARVKVLLRDLTDMEAAVSRRQLSASGPLRVDIAGSVAIHLVMPRLASLFDRHPELRLAMSITERPIDLLADGADCVIRCGPLIEQTLVARLLARLQMASFASPSYLKRHGVPKHPRELLRGHTTVAYGAAPSSRSEPVRYSRRGEVVEIQTPFAFGVDDVNVHLAAGLQGLGVITTFQFAALAPVARGELVPLFPGWRCPSTPLYVVYPPTPHPSTRRRLFVDWVVNVCKGKA